MKHVMHFAGVVGRESPFDPSSSCNLLVLSGNVERVKPSLHLSYDVLPCYDYLRRHSPSSVKWSTPQPPREETPPLEEGSDEGTKTEDTSFEEESKAFFSSQSWAQSGTLGPSRVASKASMMLERGTGPTVKRRARIDSLFPGSIDTSASPTMLGKTIAGAASSPTTKASPSRAAGESTEKTKPRRRRSPVQEEHARVAAGISEHLHGAYRMSRAAGRDGLGANSPIPRHHLQSPKTNTPSKSPASAATPEPKLSSGNDSKLVHSITSSPVPLVSSPMLDGSSNVIIHKTEQFRPAPFWHKASRFAPLSHFLYKEPHTYMREIDPIRAMYSSSGRSPSVTFAKSRRGRDEEREQQERRINNLFHTSAFREKIFDMEEALIKQNEEMLGESKHLNKHTPRTLQSHKEHVAALCGLSVERDDFSAQWDGTLPRKRRLVPDLFFGVDRFEGLPEKAQPDTSAPEMLEVIRIAKQSGAPISPSAAPPSTKPQVVGSLGKFFSSSGPSQRGGETAPSPTRASASLPPVAAARSLRRVA